MPTTRPRFSSCRHRGYGAFCHRCAQAKKLEAEAPKLKDGEHKTKLLAEAKRLETVPSKSRGASYLP